MQSVSDPSTTCVFCEIVAGRSPASVFHDDDSTLGFLSIEPMNEGHALVIPKRHAVGLSDLDSHDGRRLWDVSRRTAAALRRSGIRCEGINLFLADGRAAFQEVPHVHMHVLPRFAGDGFRIDVGPLTLAERARLDEIAGQIRSSFA